MPVLIALFAALALGAALMRYLQANAEELDQEFRRGPMPGPDDPPPPQDRDGPPTRED